MKRFVTYLYECERGNKRKNVGFIRVNVRGKETTLEVYIRNVARAADKGELFLLINDDGLQGIRLAEILIANGPGVLSLTAIKSVSCERVNQPVSTAISCRKGMEAIPPPKVKTATFANS